jgi:hypothetical protein
MSRLVIFTLILSVAHAPAVLAGDSLLESAQRATRELVASQASPAPASVATVKPAPIPDAKRRAELAYQGGQGQPGLAQSGLGKGTKIMIAFAAIAGFVGVAYAIDQGVEDNTPSSLGLR